MKSGDCYAASLCPTGSLIFAAPLSAVMIVGAVVLVEVTAGITEARLSALDSAAATAARKRDGLGGAA